MRETVGMKTGKGSVDSGWLVVGRARHYTPTKLDIGHRLQLQVSVRILFVWQLHPYSHQTNESTERC